MTTDSSSELAYLDKSIAIRQIGEDKFESYFPAEKSGAWSLYAWGGSVLSQCLNAAYHTTPSSSSGTSSHLYSVMGLFLGPTLADKTVQFEVQRLRDTRTFATRQVIVWQVQAEGKAPRRILQMTLDFFIGSGIMGKPHLAYEPEPLQPGLSHHSKLKLWAEQLDDAQNDKNNPFTVKARKLHRKLFTHIVDRMEMKIPLEGFDWERFDAYVLGGHEDLPDVDVTKKTYNDWFRPWQALRLQKDVEDGSLPAPAGILMPRTRQEAEACAIMLRLDDILPAVPMMLGGKTFLQCSNFTSLDFALRFHHQDANTEAGQDNQWFLRQSTSAWAQDGKSFNESKCWKEGRDGKLRLVATMSQTTTLVRAAKM